MIEIMQMTDRRVWRPIIFLCPSTGDRVQGLLPDGTPDPAPGDLYPILCAACDGVHFIDLQTGTVIGPKRT